MDTTPTNGYHSNKWISLPWSFSHCIGMCPVIPMVYHPLKCIFHCPKGNPLDRLAGVVYRVCCLISHLMLLKGVECHICWCIFLSMLLKGMVCLNLAESCGQLVGKFNYFNLLRLISKLGLDDLQKTRNVLWVSNMTHTNNRFPFMLNKIELINS